MFRMELGRGVLPGLATGLAVIGAAQAADLPVKAKAVEYVKVCSLYGAGFYYIPGTDTCLKLGGFVRSELMANSNNFSGNLGGPGGANNRFTNGYIWRSRLEFSLDTRTNSEYGLVRTYYEGAFTWANGNYTAANGSSIYDSVGGASAQNNASTGVVAGGYLGVYYAFIQFAGFTVGRAVSQFSAPWVTYPGNMYDGLVGGSGTITGVNQFTYTADFGQGITASVSAQDQTSHFQAGVNNINVGGAFGTSNYAGTISPDFVGSFRVDQDWGLFQASMALHDNHAAYYGGAGIADSGTELAGHPPDKWGWAAALALSIKNLPTGPSDKINFQGVYTNGATRYNIQDMALAGGATIYGSASLTNAYQSVGYGIAPDTVFGTLPDGTNSSHQLVSTWGFRGAYTHNWNPYWSSSIYGAYAAVSYNGVAKTLICGNGTVAYRGSFRTQLSGNLTSCNPDYNIGQIGLVVTWAPVKNLLFGADLTYTMLDQKMAGTITSANPGIAKPMATYQLKDQNTLTLLLRAQHNF